MSLDNIDSQIPNKFGKNSLGMSWFVWADQKILNYPFTILIISDSVVVSNYGVIYDKNYSVICEVINDEIIMRKFRDLMDTKFSGTSMGVLRVLEHPPYRLSSIQLISVNTP